MRVAFPVGIVFLSSFSLLDQLVQSNLREHMRRELVAEDAEVQRANLDAGKRIVRSLTVLAEAADIPRALPAKKGAEIALAEQLKRLGENLDEDVFALYGPNRQPIVTLP